VLQELETVSVVALEKLVAPEEAGHPDSSNCSISDLRLFSSRRNARNSQNHLQQSGPDFSQFLRNPVLCGISNSSGRFNHRTHPRHAARREDSQ